MSQARNKRENNLRAGVFVSLTLLLGLVIFTILTDAWSRLITNVSSYKVTFLVSEGIGTLASGSKVRLGGVLIGDVVSVTPRAESNKPTSKIDVVFEADKQYTLYSNASIHSRAGLLGSTGWLSITNVGEGEVATEDTILQGSTATMVSQLLGTDAEMNISKSLDALRQISVALADEGGALTILLGQEEAQSVATAISSARSGLVAMESILKSTNTVWPEWSESITSILTGSKNLPAKLLQTLQSVQETIQDVRSNILPNVEKTIQSLKFTMQSLELMSQTYREKSPQWASNITDIIQNINKMTTSAQRAIDEISASPWRLLYRPSDREMAYEQLNAASWKLLNALSDLKDSASLLEKVSNSKDAPINAQSVIESLRENVHAFEKARSDIMNRMEKDFPNR